MSSVCLTHIAAQPDILQVYELNRQALLGACLSLQGVVVAGTVWSIAINSICIELKSWLVIVVVTTVRLHMYELISVALATAGEDEQQYGT